MVHKYLSETDSGKEEFLSNIKSKYDSDLADKIKKIADGYDKNNDHDYIKSFAKTKHTNIPEKVDEIMNFTEYKKITESLNDKHIFKAIFIIGAPGSGKSEFTKFFNDEFKIINVDIPTIFNLKLAQLDLDLTKIDDDIVNTIRTKSIKQANVLYKNCINNMLPLVLDCTGRDFLNIKNQNDILNKYGYDTYMIFINTDLETAIARNKMIGFCYWKFCFIY
jgi:predicted kinase